jgi:hypothetical protein
MDGNTCGVINSKVKFYSVTAKEDRQIPGWQIIRAATLVAFDRLPKPPKPSIPESPLSIAVACVHETKGPVFLLTGVWANENELRTAIVELNLQEPGKIVPNPTPPFCTWDLAILGFERNAWVDTVLKNPTPAAIEAYLSQVLNALL